MNTSSAIQAPVVKPAPFVKWAGGKRQLLNEIIARMPQRYNTYYEPFVGGGALFFNLQPHHAVINDINSALINVYIQIRNNPDSVITELVKLDGSQGQEPKEYYYHVRDEFNNLLMKKAYEPQMAAMFIFLNKHCFNGLYRVNSKGLFNVPYNGGKQPSCSPSNITAVSETLANTTVLNNDFEIACSTARNGDFVFFDSPYAPLNATSFESYTKEGFSQESHVRLAELYKKLTDRGCFCMLTNHNTHFVRELYKDFTIDVVRVRRAINSNAQKRTGTEVIIRNY